MWPADSNDPCLFTLKKHWPGCNRAATAWLNRAAVNWSWNPPVSISVGEPSVGSEALWTVFTTADFLGWRIPPQFFPEGWVMVTETRWVVEHHASDPCCHTLWAYMARGNTFASSGSAKWKMT